MSKENPIDQINNLKPCPFCGKKPLFYMNSYKEIIIKCVEISCRFRPRIKDKDMFEAIKYWDKRNA